MTIVILIYLSDNQPLRWRGRGPIFVEGRGQQGNQAACTCVNIPGLHQRICSLDTTLLMVLAIIACFMLFRISNVKHFSIPKLDIHSRLQLASNLISASFQVGQLTFFDTFHAISMRSQLTFEC